MIKPILVLALTIVVSNTTIGGIMFVDPRDPANAALVINPVANPQPSGQVGVTVNELVNLDPAGTSVGDWVTTDFVVDATTDWTIAAMRVVLTQGMIYQASPPGGDTPTNPAFWSVSGFQHLQADTWVDHGAGNGADHSQPSFDLFPDNDDSVRQFDTSGVDVRWFNTTMDDTGRRRLARLTVSADAEGEVWFYAASEPGDLADNEIQICPTCPDGRLLIGGPILTPPEPSTLTIFVLAGLLGITRLPRPDWTS